MEGETDKRVRSVKLNLVLRLFILSINCLLVYLVVPLEALLTVGITGSIILLALLLLQLSKYLRSDDRQDNLLNYLAMTRKYVKVTTRFSAIAILGLVVATLIISQAVILSNTYEQVALDNYLEDSTDTGIEFQVSALPQQPSGFDWNTRVTEEITEINRRFGFELTLNEIESDYAVRIGLKNAGFETGQFQMEYDQIIPRPWNRETFDYLSLLPNFNLTEFDPDQEIVIYSTITREIDIDVFAPDNKIRVLVGEDTRQAGQVFSVYNWSMDYVYLAPQEDYRFLIENNLQEELGSLVNYIAGPIVLMNPELKWERYNDFVTTQIEPGDTLIAPKVIASTSYSFVGPTLKSESIAAFNERLNLFEVAVTNWLGSEFTGVIYVTSPLFQVLDAYQQTISISISLLGLLAMGPVLALTIYLLYFSVNMAEQQKERYVKIMRLRGISTTQLNMLMLTEVISIAIISSVVGMILSIPSVLRLVEFTSIGLSLTVAELFAYIPTSWFWRLPLIGMILAIDLNLPSLLRLTRQDILEPASEADSGSINLRITLDTIAFVISLLAWFVIIVIPLGDSRYSLIVQNFGPIAFILFFLSFPSIVSRIFGLVVSVISEPALRRSRSVVSLSIRNLERYSKFSKKLLSFLLLGLILLNLALILPGTYQNWGTNQINYSVGADAYIGGIDADNSSQWREFELLPEIEAATEIAMFESQDDDVTTQVLGVNTSTIVDTAYWRDEYASKSLEQIIGSILIQNQVAMQRDVMSALDLDIGDSYYIIRGGTHELVLNSNFEMFPRLVFDLPRGDIDGNQAVNVVPILTNIQTVEDIDPFRFRTETGAYVKLVEGTDLNILEDKIRTLFGETLKITIDVVEEQLEDFFSSEANLIVESTFLVMLILTIFIAAIGQ
ncbi:MAG: hypothetical protein ACXAE3_03295, partial [Candidatus Kariarchaeaceae archaeon]